MRKELFVIVLLVQNQEPGQEFGHFQGYGKTR
jgi:hypothetical protein